MKHNYLITIFDNGRYVKSYYSEGLAEIPSVRATNKGCHISVYDIKKMHTLTKDDIDKIIDEQKHVIDEKVEKPNANTPKEKADEGKKRRKRRRFENWRRPVTCVETGRTYWSIKSCSKKLGISYKAIWNSINSGTARNGLHFVNAEFPFKKKKKKGSD